MLRIPIKRIMPTPKKLTSNILNDGTNNRRAKIKIFDTLCAQVSSTQKLT